MLFPIIRVKEGEHVHIVGTNSHDTLYVDENTGGIQYLDLQCYEGTNRIGGEASMEFVTREMHEWEVYPQIEFVTLEELIKIATDEMVKQTDARIKLHEVLNTTMKTFLEKKDECEKKLENDKIRDTSGMIIF